ncbi:hypothetical protein [Desulfomicrobium baculatum]|uniref:hypothetical protein n=1 Tax=Desulfomicrobium baculatum TaxID=899 RepID=UPI001427AC2F
MVDYDLGKRIIALRERVVTDFDVGDWEGVGILTGYSDLISGHPWGMGHPSKGPRSRESAPAGQKIRFSRLGQNYLIIPRISLFLPFSKYQLCDVSVFRRTSHPSGSRLPEQPHRLATAR